MEHPIDNMMQTTMESIRDMVDVNTVVGSPVLTGGGSTIIPISKVSFGFIAGGGEYAGDDKHGRESVDKYPFAGGSGAGVSVQPVGFLVVGEGTVKMLPAQFGGAAERIVDMLPQMIEDLKSMDDPKKKRRQQKKQSDMELSDEEEIALCEGVPVIPYGQKNQPQA